MRTFDCAEGEPLGAFTQQTAVCQTNERFFGQYFFTNPPLMYTLHVTPGKSFSCCFSKGFLIRGIISFFLILK